MKTVWTIGHSNRTFEEFVNCLTAAGIKSLVDVRRFPGSRAHPHFNAESLNTSLIKFDIQYFHSIKLGGRRKANPDSVNSAWRNTSFRAYADYLTTPEFQEGLQELLDSANKMNTAYMCSEALWWQCHRRLISDYLAVHGWNVIHIMGENKTDIHRLMDPARIVNGELSYAPA